jgi:hypothetical protein
MAVIINSRYTLLLAFLLLLTVPEFEAAQWNKDDKNIAISAHRGAYEKDRLRIPDDSWDAFDFGRSQSPQAINEALSRVRRRAFKRFQGKDGRHGMVTSTKLGGDWVLAESVQTAVQCSAEEVLSAYLSGQLQKSWNPTQVLDCTITRCHDDPEAYYQQDLVLHSQRVIRSHTGIMKYSQRISIDKIGQSSYCVSIRLDPSAKTTTTQKPFEKLSVYVGLRENGQNVDIYAAGIMKVNRKVVPNLVVFDASGIAGSMAGKGTLWLSAHFAEKKAAAEKL